MVAVRSVLTDEGFSIASEPARNARAVASRVLQWCDDACNLQRLTVFAQELLQLLQECFATQQLNQAGENVGGIPQITHLRRV